MAGVQTVAPAQTATAEKDRWTHKTHNNIKYIHLFNTIKRNPSKRANWGKCSKISDRSLPLQDQNPEVFPEIGH